MRHTGINRALHLDTGFFQGRFQQGTVFAQRVDLRVDDGDRWQPGQLGIDDVQARVRLVLWLGQQLVDKPAEHGFVQGFGGSTVLVRLGVEVAGLADRVHRQNMHGLGQAGVTHRDGGGHRQVAAGTFTGQCQARRVAFDGSGIGSCPLVSRQRVVPGRWKLDFRRQPVIHRHHHRLRLLGQPARAAVIHLLVGQHPAAAVKVNHHRKRACTIGRVNSRRDVARCARNFPVHTGHAGHQGSGCRVLAFVFQHGHDRIGGCRLLARLWCAQALNRLAAQGRQRVQHGLHVGIGFELRAGFGHGA